MIDHKQKIYWIELWENLKEEFVINQKYLKILKKKMIISMRIIELQLKVQYFKN
jgi:hypothetical protein